MEDQQGYFINDSQQRIYVSEEKKAFTFARTELIAALILFPAAYIYTDKIFLSGLTDIACLIFAALFVSAAEVICKDIPRSRESIIWLGCLAVCAVSASFEIVPEYGTVKASLLQHSVWDQGQTVLFMHIFGVWYVLSRSGRLLDGESGHMLPADAFDGFVLFPFGHFFLRIRIVFSALKNALSGDKKSDRKFSWWSLAAAAAACVLLVNAVQLLSAADSGFEALIDKIKISFNFNMRNDWGLILETLILSFPVGAYLFGLLAGSARTEDIVITGRRDRLTDFLVKLRKVPSKLWLAVIAVFSIFYAVFFFIQGEYLFGAFAGKLPAGFIVSQYARQGFFELCKVTALNFTLLWMVTRAADVSPAENRPLTVACVFFLAESMIFCLIAFSKLMLYIKSFGFTPLRLESSWLVSVLFLGCVLWITELLTGRKVFKTWMIYGAVSLSALTLI